MKIAIIGGGVSGLSLAYYLHKYSQGKIEINVYEQADRVGGNALTQELDLSPLGRPNTWVDMGVNDFNINTYKAMLELWEEIKLPQNEYVGTLVNDASFFYYGATPEDTYGFKVSINGDISVHNLDKDTPNKIKQGFEDFEKFLKEWYEKNEENPSAFQINVEQFIYQYFTDSKYKPFVELALLPRINAMFFTYEESPVGRPPVLDMPMWLVSHYYVLQEGLALDPKRPEKDKERKFFNQGCQKWLEFLKEKLTNDCKVNVQLGIDGIKVCSHGTGAYVYYNYGESNYYDKVVFCTPAYEVERITDSLYLAGNYCNGAGLHTECILFSKDLAHKIVDPTFVSENFYDYQGITKRHPAPAYIREVLGISH